MLAFLFAAALAVAKIHASQVTMDAKIRDDSDLSQVKCFIPDGCASFLDVAPIESTRRDATRRRHVANMRHDLRVLEPSRRNDRARESCV